MIFHAISLMHHLDFSFHEVPFHGKKMLEALHLGFSYNDQPLIHDLSFSIEKRDRIAIIGKNGFGKSTILKLLVQELSPTQGHIHPSLATRIGYFGQTSIDRLNAKMTVEEEIASANPNLNFTQIRSVAGLMMFSSDLAKKSISVLSGGEKSRVLLGKIVAQPCNLLLLDEPTHHLDIESIEALIDAIEEFSGSVVIVTHSEWILRRIPLNKLIICHQQKQQLFLGSYDEFLEKEGWVEEKTEVKKKTAPALVKHSLPSKAQIKKIEDKIIQHEATLGKLNAELGEVSQTGDGTRIKQLIEEIRVIQQQIDDLFEQVYRT